MGRWRSRAVARSSKRVSGSSSRSAVTRPRWRWASSGNAPRGIAPTSGGRSGRPKRVGEPCRVALRAAVVRDDAGEPEVRREAREALDEGGDAPPHPVDVCDEKDRGVEPAGDLGRAPLVGCRIGPVEEPHHPFDEGAIGVRRGPLEEAPDVVLPGHPAVQVVAGPPGGEGKVGRVEEVRPHLEGLDAQAPAGERPGEGERERRLPRSAVGPGDDQCRAVRHQYSTPFVAFRPLSNPCFTRADLGDRVGGGDEPLRGAPAGQDDGDAGGLFLEEAARTCSSGIRCRATA